MRPWLGARNPLMMENSVVLPAPLGPISAVMRPVSAASETSSTASTPSKRLHTRSTRSSCSSMRTLPYRLPPARKARAEVHQHACNSARGEGDDQDEHAAVNDEVEAGRIAGDELGRFAQRLDDQCAEQRAEHGADPADDGCEQSLDGNPRPVGDAGIDEQKILCIESSAGGGDCGGSRHGGELDPRGVD